MDKTTDVVLRLGILEDRQQITEVIYQYCRGVDRCDVEATRRAFWPDASFPESAIQGCAAEFVDPLITVQRKALFAGSQHFMGNILIKLKGDEATLETYGLAHHRSHPSKEGNEAMLGAEVLMSLGKSSDQEYGLLIGFRYLDRFLRRGETWRIIERRIVFDWSHAAPYSGIEKGLYAISGLRGAPRSDDPLYSHW